MKFITVLILGITMLMNGLIAGEDDEKFGGLVFFNYSYTGDDKTDVSNSFDFKRIYFTYEKKLSDKVKVKFQTDAGWHKKDDNNTNMFVYLKNAKLDWSTSAGTIIIGMQGMNLFKVQEETWGYRFIEMSAMDVNKYSSSADLGLGYANTFNENINFNLLVTNGGGYKKPEKDKYKKITGQLVYGNTRLDKKDGFNIGGVISYEPYDENDQKETRQIFALLGGYAGYGFRAGIEYNTFNDSNDDNDETIFSIYANYKLNDDVDVYARFDGVNGEQDYWKYYIAGMVFTPVKGFKIAPNVRYITQERKVTIYYVNFEFRY